MGKRFIDGSDFTAMVIAGGIVLEEKAAEINALNVFPVPDGDTGTNMKLTWAFAVEQLRSQQLTHIGNVAEILSKGLLMGARGNSGVIVSQLFRGFAKSVQHLERVNTNQWAAALLQGVETAYQAVVKPVEGTILTVSKQAATHAVRHARATDDVVELMRETLRQAKETLQHTPELLPILKQAGVVDAGGQGLICIYEGFLQVLNGSRVELESIKLNTVDQEQAPHPMSAQAFIATEDIEFPYDMEFFIHMPQKQQRAIHFDENVFRAQLAQDGDSVIVIVDDPMIKVHVHSKCPGDVLNLATQYGELNQIHILNMRDQHREIMRLAEENPVDSVQATSYTGQIADDGQLSSSDVGAYKHYGMIAVAAGQGIADIFTSLGIDCVLSGGQTMNPSTEEIVNAILKVNSEHVFIFPNNSNIILAAEQAKRLVDKSIVVIPTVSIPQGIAAALALQVDGSLEQNIEAMKTALHGVRSGQVTCAVRDSSMEGLRIEENDYIGMLDQKIIVSHPDVLETCISLLAAMIIEGDEVLTIMTGAEAEALQTSLLVEHLEHSFPDVEVEVLSGGQPLYSYLFSVE